MTTALPKKAFLLFFVCFVLNATLLAQVATYYNWTQSTTTYTPGYPTGVATPADIFPTSWDDLAYTGYKLPFDFTYNGILYTAANGYIGLDTDGWFCFSNGVPSMSGQLGGGSWVSASDHTGVYLLGTANNNGFAGFNADLHYQSFATFNGKRVLGNSTITNVSSFTDIQIGTRLSGNGIPNGTVVIGFNVGANTITMSANATANAAANNANAITPYASIYAFTRGTAPNRQYIVQWTQARRYNSPGITTDNFNFQMILNEAGGVPNLQTLQVVYGNVTTAETANLEFQVGLRGTSATDFNARTSTTSWSSTTAATANTDHVRLNNSIKPSSGLTFTWSPCTVAPGAAGAISGTTSVCPGSTVVYSIAAVSGASNYTWTYSGTNTSFTATTASPSNSFVFANNATGGTITVTPNNLCGSGAPSSLAVTVKSVSSATISYALPTYCKSASPASVTRTGPAGGTYSAAPSGLTLNSSTGQITPSSSAEGTYTVSYAYNDNGCSLTATTTVEIKAGPLITATASPNMVCSGGGNSQLQASVSSGYTVASIPYSMLTPSGPSTTIWNSYQLDAISGAISLPFTFTYYGQSVNQIYATTEGYMQLQTSTGYDYTPDAIPNSATPNNIIALAWCDLVLDPGSNPGAMVRYFVNGTAPNRVFVLDYYKLRFLAAAGEVTGQIRLYENGNIIEVAITRVDDEGDNDNKTLGIENSTGTDGTSPTGRNLSVWNTTNEAWRFSLGGPYTYAWSPATYLNNTSIYNPTATGIVSSITYTVRVTDQPSGCYTDQTVPITVTSPLNGTYTVGASGNFPTLTAAVNAYNTQCIGGPVTFSLIDNTYSGAETFPIFIKPNSYQSAINTLTIKPATGVNATISSNLSGDGLLRISGNYIKIDGSNLVNGSSRNLTITNNNTISPLEVIVHSGSAARPVQGVAIKNCNISSGSNDLTFSGIVFSDSSTIYNAGYFKYDTVYNNSISKVTDGIFVVGAVAAGNGNGIYIAKNDLSTSGSNNSVSEIGIYAEGVDGAVIEDNLMANFKGSDANDDKGIWVALGSKNVVVNRNKIYSLNYTGTGGYGSHGIYISASGAANIMVSNNMIADISGDGFNYNNAASGLDNPAGILLYGSSAFPQNGIKIYHNSIHLFGNTLNKNNAVAFGIRLTDYNTADIRNNIIVNNLGLKNSTGLGAVGIYVATNNSQFQFLDYNDYYINPSSGSKNLGGINGTFQTTMAGWRTATGKEANSLNINPVFSTTTDLHLTPASNLSLNETAPPLALVPLDFDSTTRNGLRVDVGADEFLAPNTGSWVGHTSIDWLVKSNWETSTIPDATTDVTVTGGYTYLPTIVTVQPVRDLVLKNSSPVVTLNGGTLQVYRNFNVTNGYIVGNNGTLEMKGSAAQNIPAALFQNNNLLNLIIDNSDAATGVTLNGALDIYRSLTFGASGRKLNTNDYLTFKSTATQTAWLGKLTASNVITGKATIERNIPLHSKAWQFLSTPINASSTITVKDAWQEGATVANGNPHPGYGTQLGSPRTNAVSQPNPGFDVKSVTPSIKVYDRSINNYRALNRTDTVIYNPKGYMVFVRGDRSVINFSGPNSSPTGTVMRMKGTLNTPANPPATVSIASLGFESAGNPYPSAIDYHKLTFSGGANPNTFYLWDPKLTNGFSAYGLGAFQTFTWNSLSSTFDVTPGSGSFSGSNRNIESGQAFFFYSGGAGTLQFTEAAKESGSNNNNRVMAPVRMNMLRTNLRVMVNEQPELIDGVMIQYGNFQNSVDEFDALKLNNTGENIAMANGSSLLSVERRRNIETTDTVFYRLGQLRVKEYEFEFIPRDIAAPGLQAWLEDAYLNTAMPVSLHDTGYVRFQVTTNEGSYAPNRFRLVFVQKRAAGIKDNVSLDISATGGGNLKNEKEIRSISVYPNPVVNKEIKLTLQHFKNRERVNLQLVDALGNMVMNSEVEITGKVVQCAFNVKGIASGAYRLVVMDSEGERTSLGVSIP